ncbi:unnamed protein product [Scytosiphon promiscuus]
MSRNSGDILHLRGSDKPSFAPLLDPLLSSVLLLHCPLRPPQGGKGEAGRNPKVNDSCTAGTSARLHRGNASTAMARRFARLSPWVETLALVLVIACCDASAEREQQTTPQEVTRADASARTGQRGLPATVTAADADARLMGAPWSKSGRSVEYVLDNERFTAAGATSGGGDGRRRLQDAGSCAVGGDFTLSSTIYPSSDGCYSLLDSTDLYSYTTAAFDRIVAPFTLSEDTSDLFVWGTGEILDSDTIGLLISLECISLDAITADSHPSDVSEWYCYMFGAFYPVTEASVDMTCGCSDGPTLAPAPTPAPAPVDADSPEGASGCGGEDSFTITSPQLEEYDGCYQDASEDDGDTFFSATGDRVDGTLAVFPGAVDEQGVDVRWIVGAYAENAEDVSVTCVSVEHPSDVHPADSSFVCDLTGTGAYTAVTDDQFGISCGCSSTSSASDGDASVTPTPSPTSDSRGISVDTPSPSVGDTAASSASSTATPSAAGDDDVPAPGDEPESPSSTTPSPADGAPGIGATISPEASGAVGAIASNGAGGLRTAPVVGLLPLVAGAAGAVAGLVGTAAEAGLLLLW